MPRGLAAIGVLLLAACQTESLTSPTAVDLPALTVTAVDGHTAQVRWPSAPGDVNSFRLERRANLEGPFSPVTGNLPRATTSYLDRDLLPDTPYGYRLLAFNSFGQAVGSTTVAGTRTPPPPTLRVTTRSTGGTVAEDLDGYQLRVSGPGTTFQVPIAGNATEAFSPLPPGTYQVDLNGLAPQCEHADSARRSVAVTDQGVATVTTVVYSVTCRNPGRGRVRVTVAVEGDTLDPTGYRVVLSGLGRDPGQTAPVPVLVSANLGGLGGTVPFEDLFPGTYSVVLEGVDKVCELAGPPQVDNVVVTPLALKPVSFQLNCQRPDVGGNGPLVLSMLFSPDSAIAGARVELPIVMDLSADPNEHVAAFQMLILANAQILTFDSVKAGNTFSLIANPVNGGVNLVGFTTTAQKGRVTLARLYYSVVGATGQKLTADPRDLLVARSDGSSLLERTRVVRGSFTVGQKQGPNGGGNRPPVARANGPYSGAVNTPIAFSAAGSSDPDGQIVSYAWSFGDGTTGSGASVSHRYATAGIYPAQLTVTDNQGATATATAAVTVTGTTPPPAGTPLVWKAEFGPVDVTNLVSLNLSYDLREDLPETAGPESLKDWELSVLQFDPAVLQYLGFNPSTGTASVDASQANIGRLKVRGIPNPAATGLANLGRVRFLVRGSAGQFAITQTTLGPLNSATTTLDYRSRTRIVEDTLVLGSPPPPSGTSVSGSVTSPQSGPLANVTVSISGAGSAVTGATGAWTVSGVPTGNRTVTVSNLPAGCTAPPAQTVSVGSTPVTGVNFSVTCASTPPPSGVTVSGSVTSPQSGPLANVTVSISGAGSAATSSTGAWSVANVAAGNRTVSLGNLPAGCTAPPAQTVTVGTSPVAGVNFSVTCAAAPAQYQMRTTWGTVSGGRATARFVIDMSTRNDPANNGTGPDLIAAFEGTFTYPARLSAPACIGQGGFAGGINTGVAGQVRFALFNSSGASGSAVALVECTFTVAAGAPAALSSVPPLLFADSAGNEFTSFVNVTHESLP